MRSSTKWAWLASASLALSSCSGKEAAERASATLPAGESLKLAASDIADMKAVGAEITTRDSAEALARIPGTLVSLSVREGDTVKKGQRIGTVVDARLGYETSVYGAQVAAAQAEAARARSDLARIQDLYNNKVYARARLDQAVAMSRAADAQVAAARAQQGASASVAGQGAILAPASGRVLRADIPAGSVVTAGMSVATITAGPPLLRLELPESLAGQVRNGAQILVAEGDLPDGSRQGRVTQVYPAVTGGRVRVDATAPGLSTQFVGRRVGVSIEVGRRRALVVPRRFVSTRYGIDQVDVVTADRRVSAVPVQVAPTADPDKIEILSGVAAGDTLFRAGSRK
ncbi:efflux RND transporter periplasmic adaptor subunit [Sphingomonas sp. MMS24-J13]|uniref:efflux RND transporter periplasmic adaptor subunit n=1 Tax=Sphingomonas sp. MMS24-J13 TaxID=3238686 RepID=UPI00384EC285